MRASPRRPRPLRYLHFLLEAINNLPKEPEGIFYRGVGPDANEARLHC